MLTKRIIPCLDIKDGRVVKGTRFKEHRDMGDMFQLAQTYSESGADELVLYDISASSEKRVLSESLVMRMSEVLDIPFCVAGGIDSIESARVLLEAGADKVSVNSPALKNPTLIDDLVSEFGSQCVVVGVDSWRTAHELSVYIYTGSEKSIRRTQRKTIEWIQEVESRGAGEVVVNCMNEDGVKSGYDIVQLEQVKNACGIPVIASGGCGQPEDFYNVFQKTGVDGGLAASIFHENKYTVKDVKGYLNSRGVEVRL